MQRPEEFLKDLLNRYPALEVCQAEIQDAYGMMAACYEEGGKLLIAGNGGSGADAGHIVGELMKGFLCKRALPDNIQKKLLETNEEMGGIMASRLQGALPAIDLTAHGALITAFGNDVDGDLIFAQQIIGYGKPGDIFIGISTSGNSRNILYGLCAAKTMGLMTIGLTGQSGGKMKDITDITICVPASTTPSVQEYHLPVYHALCAMVEARFFKG